jgi:hypothetical protein
VEALENIKVAIREWLDAESDEKSKIAVIERIITVQLMPRIPGVGLPPVAVATP